MTELLRTKIAIVENEVHTFQSIFERLDKTLSSVTEVSHAIQKILAVHETKIEVSEVILSDLKKTNDEIRKSFNTQFEKHQLDIQKELTFIKNEIAIINKWRYIVYGACIVGGFLIGKVFPLFT